MPIESDRLLDPQHIFHEKVGIFTDIRGDRLAFSGSNNESLAGWSKNVESFHVYCDWEGDRDVERVQEEAFRFEQLWNDLSPNVKIFEVPEAVQKKLLHYAPNNKPTWTRQIEFDTKALPKPKISTPEPKIQQLHISEEDWQTERKDFEQLIHLHQHPGCLDFCLKSIPIQPWSHQLKILRQSHKNFLIEDLQRRVTFRSPTKLV
jgi:hypothetical protein